MEGSEAAIHHTQLAVKTAFEEAGLMISIKYFLILSCAS